MPRPSAMQVGWVVIQVVVALLVIFTILRVFQPGSSQIVIVVAALTPWPYFLAWPIAVASLLRRHWVVGAIAVALVVVQVVLVYPTWKPTVSAAPPVGAWRLKVFSANVLFSNFNLDGIASEIKAYQPNVISLEELSHQGLASLIATGAVAGYRYTFLRPTYDSTGLGVWSDVPLTGSEVWYTQSHAEYTGTLHPSTGPPITLLGIHTFAPHGVTGAGVWSAQMRAIADRVESAPRPLIAVGDFNATDDMKQFRVLLHDHLHDAAVARGEGWRMTWPRNRHVIPPFLRPDHLLYSDGLTATAYSVGIGGGSDHKPILTELARAD